MQPLRYCLHFIRAVRCVCKNLCCQLTKGKSKQLCDAVCSPKHEVKAIPRCWYLIDVKFKPISVSRVSYTECFVCSSISTVSRTSQWADAVCATATPTCAISTTSGRGTSRGWCASVSTTHAATSVRNAAPASCRNHGDRPRRTEPTSANVSDVTQAYIIHVCLPLLIQYDV